MVQVPLRSILAGSIALFLLAGIIVYQPIPSIAHAPAQGIVPTTPRVISIMEYTQQSPSTGLRLHRHVRVRNAAQITVLASDLNRLHLFNAGPTWHCPIFRAGWYDLLLLSYVNGTRQDIKVWTVCPPVAVVAGQMYGNFSGKPWLRLIHDLNDLLRGR